MKLKYWLSLVAVMSSGSAQAFPIAATAVAGSALGILLWPILAVLVAAGWLYKSKGKALGKVLGALAAFVVFALLHQDFSAGRLVEANLYNPADLGPEDTSIPFSFLSHEAQAKSDQGVSPEEFLNGIKKGHFKALKLSTGPGLFMSEAQVSASEIWADQKVLEDAIKKLGGRVVLIDKHGGIAGSVAELAKKALKLDIGFLEGGTSALSDYGWKSLQGSFDERELPAIGYQKWLSANPDAYILSLTTDREFLTEGWLFGDKTLTLVDFLSHFDVLQKELSGKKIFLAGFETSDIGAAPVALSILQDAGLETYFVKPDPNEVLLKDAYVKAYANNDRLISLDDAKRFILHREDVAFLDFSEKGWPIADRVVGEYHHFPMHKVAAGDLAQFVEKLDPQMNYIGLGFDRRTSYHSLIAGEMLTNRGAGWLGRFTLPDELTGQFFDNEEFVSSIQTLAYKLKTGMAGLGAKTITANLGLPLLSMLIASMLLGFWISETNVGRVGFGLTLYFVSEIVFLAYQDYSLPTPRLGTLVLLVLVACFGYIYYLRRKGDVPPITSLSTKRSKLPPKASNLNKAAELGFHVPSGQVFKSRDGSGDICDWPQGKLIVRSAHSDEAVDHQTTAGLYHSEVIEDRKKIPAAMARILTSNMGRHNVSYVLIQRYVEADFYGVVQFQEDGQSGSIICEAGPHGAVTSGAGATERCVIPMNKAGIADAPKLPKIAARALIKLLQIDAYSVEFAINKSGLLTILQVNTDKTRACAARRLMEIGQKQYLEVQSHHTNPLSAAIVAAMQPGDMIAFGNRRFTRHIPAWRLMLSAWRDTRHFGFKSLTCFDQMITCVEDEQDKPVYRYEFSGTSVSVVDQVVDRIQYIADTYGRLNRLATAADILGKNSRWRNGGRILLTSYLGQKWKECGSYARAGIQPMPVGSFNAYGEQTFENEDISFVQMKTSSPAAFVKDAATFQMMLELGAMKPALEHIIKHGAADELMAKLGTQVGHWRADLECEVKAPATSQILPLKDLIEGKGGNVLAVRVPPQGIEGPVSLPGAHVDSGILVIPSCNIVYQPLLEDAIAIVAMSGSITSHLMQHASAMGKPVVITPLPAGDLQAGDQVWIDSEGGVRSA